MLPRMSAGFRLEHTNESTCLCLPATQDLGNDPEAEKHYRDTQAMWLKLTESEHSVLLLDIMKDRLTNAPTKR